MLGIERGGGAASSGTCWRRSSTARRRTPGSAPGSTAWSRCCTGRADIREVIAFPKTKSASEPMTGAPTLVSDQQLTDLHISVTEVEADASG